MKRGRIVGRGGGEVILWAILVAASGHGCAGPAVSAPGPVAAAEGASAPGTGPIGEPLPPPSPVAPGSPGDGAAAGTTAAAGGEGAAGTSTLPPEPAPAPSPPVDTRVVAEDLRRALTLVARGDGATATPILQRLTREAPGRPEPHFALGVLADTGSDPEAAADHYRAALQADPAYWPAAYNLANALARSRKGVAGAIAEMRDLSRRHPDSIPLTNALNHLYLHDRRYEEVIRSSREVFRKDERNVPAMVNMAIANYHMRKTELARAILETALSLDPTYAEAHHYLGLIYLDQNKKDLALAAFRKAVEANPSFPEALNNLGLLYHEAGDYHGAVDQFKAAVAASPRFGKAYLNLGNSYRGMQQFRQAEEAYRKALDLDPGYADAFFNLGVLYLDARPEGDAVKQYQDAIENFNRYKRLMGASLQRKDPVDKYIEEARKRIEAEQKREEQRRAQPKEAPDRAGNPGAAGEATPPSPEAPGAGLAGGGAKDAAAAPPDAPTTTAPEPGSPSAAPGADAEVK